VTSLPIPGHYITCKHKYDGNISIATFVYNIFKVLLGGGTHISGSGTACGDYLFSGHTVILLVCTIFTVHYSKSLWNYRFYKTWKYLNIMITVVGVFGVILSHEHYTIDVICAYYVTTTLIWTYHGIVDNTRWRDILADKQNRSLGFKKFWWVQTGFIHLIESETTEFVDEVSLSKTIHFLKSKFNGREYEYEELKFNDNL